MRNAINKDFFREIKYTLNRYVSILLIVALGVAFLAGIRATCPDMKLTLDHYLDEADYMDLRVLSTLGLTGEDLTAIAEVDGVKEVDGAHSYDAFVMNGNEKWTLRFLSEPVSVNKLEITEGRDIENANECVVDHLLIEKDGYHIGDQITVVPPGKGEKLSDTLTESTFTIVGVAASPEYFTTTRDTTSVGTGQTDAFVFLSPEVFKSDIYSAVYITVDGAAAKQAYSDDYEAVVDKVKAKLEAISSEREAARYNEIMDDANTEIDDARDKLADAKQKRNQSLMRPGHRFRMENSRSVTDRRNWMTIELSMQIRLPLQRRSFLRGSRNFRMVRLKSRLMSRSFRTGRHRSRQPDSNWRILHRHWRRRSSSTKRD